MSIGMPTSPTNLFKPAPQQVEFGGGSGPSSTHNHKTEPRPDIFERSTASTGASSSDTLQKKLAEADRMQPQLDNLLSNIKQGKPVGPIKLPEGSPARAKFQQETAALKAHQAKVQYQAAQKNNIEDTPELRAALLKYGAVANETELEAFLAKFGVKQKAE